MKMIMITCAHCGVEAEKPLNEIKRRKKLGKTKFYCSLNCSARVYKPNLEIWNKSDENKKRLAENSKKWNARRLLDDRWKVREPLRRVRSRVNAGAYGGVTDLTLEYLLEVWNNQKGKCAYTNVDLIPVMGGRCKKELDKNYQSSLDRIDSSIGYMKGNVQFVSVSVNWLKNSLDDAHVEKFFKIIQNINILTDIAS